MTDQAVENLTSKVRKYAKSVLKDRRYKHSIRVAKTASYMCSIFGCDKTKAYFAGIAHDICKDMDDKDLISLAKEDNLEITDIEMSKPSLLHGRASATLLKDKFGVDDEEILEAIRNHTFGKAGMGPLAKIIYVADKIEPGREQSTKQYRKKLYAMSLNQMTLYVVQENMEYLRSKDKRIADSSFAFESELKEQAASETML